jgi:hypothetical protein
MAVNEIAGGTLRSEAKVAADATMALLYAMARVEDGDQRLNLVVAHAKESQAQPHGIELAAFDPYFQRPLDPDETVAAALQAGLFYGRGSFGPEDAARVVAAARARSDVLPEVDAADVLAAPPTATPLRALDRAPLMDAAGALVICDGDTAERLGRPAARLVAGAARTGPYWTERDLTTVPGLADAVDEALEWAGWTRGELDHVELNVPYAHQVLMLGAELGLGDRLVERLEGEDRHGPRLNATGAWLAGSAGTVAGLASAAAAASAVREQGGRWLVHGATGLCAQSHSVALIEGPL